MATRYCFSRFRELESRPIALKNKHIKKITTGTKIFKNKKKRNSEKLVNFSIIIILQADISYLVGQLRYHNPVGSRNNI